jgi:hypothetical protein
MAKKTSQWLISKKQVEGRMPGNALVKWLNDPDFDSKFVEGLLLDAQVVFRWIEKYGSLHKLNLARKQKKLPAAFWDCHQRLNDTLATLTYAPQIDLDELEDGERVSRMLIAEHLPKGLPSVQLRLLVQVIEQGAILKIRRCQQCSAWYFAHFLHQDYCTNSCRIKHLTGTEAFKKKRREYMRQYNALQKSGKVK